VDVGMLAALQRPMAARRLMGGVLVSAKTLEGRPTTNRRYPAFVEVDRLLHALSRFAWPVIHFNSPVDDAFEPRLQRLLEATPHCRGLQLNVRRPPADVLRRLRRDFPAVEIILQVNGSSLRSLAPHSDRSDPFAPAAVDAYISSYVGVCAHALLDRSGGTGQGLDLPWAASCLAEFGARWLDRGIRPAVAGGLGPESAVALASLWGQAGARWAAACSVDAESAIRHPSAAPLVGEPYQDDLDARSVAAYVAVADSPHTQAPSP
jgi:hypothetical protein